MKTIHKISIVLLIIGGLNWLLVGLFNWDVGMIFGGQSAVISKIIYILVGLSAINIMFTHNQDCKYCEKSMKSMPSGAPKSSPM